MKFLYDDESFSFEALRAAGTVGRVTREHVVVGGHVRVVHGRVGDHQVLVKQRVMKQQVVAGA